MPDTFDYREYVNPSPEVAAHQIPDDGSIPNNPALPILIYAGALDLSRASSAGIDPAAVCESVFGLNGWGNSWRNGIYDYQHYHSTAHEVLAICRGEARVQLGGEKGVTVQVTPGDVIVLPAGAGHKNLGASADLLVVGAYPPGQQWDLCRGTPDERPAVLENIADVPMPGRDPVYGGNGPLFDHWT